MTMKLRYLKNQIELDFTVTLTNLDGDIFLLWMTLAVIIKSKVQFLNGVRENSGTPELIAV